MSRFPASSDTTGASSLLSTLNFMLKTYRGDTCSVKWSSYEDNRESNMARIANVRQELLRPGQEQKD